MTMQANRTVSLFDKYSLVIPKGLKWSADGPPGQRVLFITDKKESFTVSFEEGMKPRDMTPDTDKSVPTVSYQCCKDGKYIHQKRNTAGNMTYSYFHIELEDDDGKTLYLSGQIVVTDKYQWSDGVEPVLLELLEGIAVCKTKGGGSD